MNMEQSSKSPMNPLVIPIIIILLGGGVGAYFAMQQENPNLVAPQAPLQNQQQPPSQQQQPTTPSAPVNVSMDDDHVLGDASAPVTIIEFSDYQCPFCKRFRDDSFDVIKSQYIDTGKAKFVYRDFPLDGHANAQKAAEAAECAGDQDKYWEMHDMLFANPQGLDVVSLKAHAVTLGLDTTEFNSCLDSGENAEEVRKDYADGIAAGVDATPTLYINGVEVRGAKPTEEFIREIERQLSAS